MVQHVHRKGRRFLDAVKALATARFLQGLQDTGVVATQPTQPTEEQNAQEWKILPIVLALLLGTILANLFLRSQPLQLFQVSIYNLAEWLWRFVYYFLVCITGPTETDESLWNPSWRPAVTADTWQDEYQAVPDPYPDIPRAIPCGSFHRSDRKMPNVVVPKDEPEDAIPLSSTVSRKFPQVIGQVESSSDDDAKVPYAHEE